jgi:VanZ family protein
MVQRMDPKAVRAWALVVVWSCFVWGLGADGFSQAQTSRFLAPLLRWIYPDIGPEHIATLQMLVRKSAHFFEYGLLAILTLRALLISRGPSLASTVGLALVFVISFASADETRQAFSSQRGGSIWDVLLDGAGAAVAIGILLLVRLRFGEASEDPFAATIAIPGEPGSS